MRLATTGEAQRHVASHARRDASRRAALCVAGNERVGSAAGDKNALQDIALDRLLQDREPEPSGREGLIDVRIINALYRSVETAQVVKLPRLRKNVRPTMKLETRRPAVKKPQLVKARAPSKKS